MIGGKRVIWDDEADNKLSSLLSDGKNMTQISIIMKVGKTKLYNRIRQLREQDLAKKTYAIIEER